MAKSKVDVERPAPTLIGNVMALLHKLPPGSLIVAGVAAWMGYLMLRGMEHGTESSKNLGDAIREQTVEQKDHNAKVRANQERMIEQMKVKP